MAVGLAAFQTANDINSMAGGMARDLHSVLGRIAAFQSFLVATDLKAAPYSMSPDDETSIKSAFTDLAQLGQVYEGAATRTPAYDYRTFAKRLYGFGTA